MWTADCRGALLRAGLLAAGCLAGLPFLQTQAEARGREARAVAAPSAFQADITDTPRFFTIAQVLARREGRPAPTRPLPVETGAVRIASINVASLPAMSGPQTPFSARGFRLFSASSGQVRARWMQVQARLDMELAEIERCQAEGRGCTAAVRSFVEIRDAVRAADSTEQLALVNTLVNGSVRYMADVTRHGVADVWSTPLVTLGSAGDCEDYAIAKYALLASAGRPFADMRIILLRDRMAGEDHAVLAVREAGQWHLLDNRWNRIDADGAAPHYRPVFALGEGSIDLFAAPFSERGGADPDLISTASAWGQAPVVSDADAHLNGELLRALSE